MEYGYKVTTNGRNLIAACMAAEKPLKLTRVSIGSGTVADGVDLATVHELIAYVADGEIAERSHEDERLNLTIQYANALHKSVPTFYLAEFMVFAEDPDTGAETDLLYATLGDYKQPVPAYVEGLPGSVFNLPLVLVVSNDLTVEISASPGLVTYADLDEAVKDATKDVGGIVATIHFTIAPGDWQSGGTGSYPLYADVANEAITSALVPEVVFYEESLDIAASAKLCKTQTSYNGIVRFKSKAIPTANISGVLYLIGKATGSGGGGGQELVPATRSSLGGVIIGNGLNVQPDGKTSVDKDAVVEDVTPKVVEEATAPEADVDAMLDEVFGPETESSDAESNT